MIHRSACLVLIALSIAGSAPATDEAVQEGARQHYDRGLQLSDQGRYEQALSEFLAAYQQRPHFAALYNIAQAYIELGRSVEAIEALERYLKDGKDQISAERVEHVRVQIAAEQARTAQLVVSVETLGARITVDGVSVGSAPRVGPLRVSAGAHDVGWSAPGLPAVHRSIVLAAGQTLELAFPGAVPAAAAPVASPPLDARFERASPLLAHGVPAEESGGSATLGYVLGGVGLALGGVAFGHYLWNRERHDRWQTNRQSLETDATGGPAQRERQLESNRLAASIERASHWTVALGVAGGAFFASGATLLIVRASAPSAPSAPLRESASVLMIQGVW